MSDSGPATRLEGSAGGEQEPCPDVPEEPPLATPGVAGGDPGCLQPHWFYRHQVESKSLWVPFSHLDSASLERASRGGEAVVRTDGGRCDVHVKERLRVPVYWEGPPSEVRRCTWFYKPETHSGFVPYEEDVAALLEEHYGRAVETGKWHERLELPGRQTVVMHSATVMVQLPSWGDVEDWGSAQEARPRAVKRGLDGVACPEEGEPPQVDHVVFVVHGVGSACDLRLRTVEECLEDMRQLALGLLSSHFKSAPGRLELLPVSWHWSLHTAGVDAALGRVSLDSIPKLRRWANDTLLDVLLYTSPVYCQTIVDAVGQRMNRLYRLFRDRNPSFAGTVALAGHSLGSLILFDILLHQGDCGVGHLAGCQPKTDLSSVLRSLGLEAYLPVLVERGVDSLHLCSDRELEEMGIPEGPRQKLLSYLRAGPGHELGTAGTGQLLVNYPRLEFQPSCFFALGSPIAMFLVVRGNDILGKDFRLPTCPAFFNIFHPFDPVAYRMERLIDPELSASPVVVPHHRGRKRMHLELKESLRRVGTDLRQRLLDSWRLTWHSLHDLAHGASASSSASLATIDDSPASESGACAEAEPPPESLGRLNGGRRIDYVLQEKPIESFNEYLFALASHACYWESEDTVLLMLTELYALQGLKPDPGGRSSQEPQGPRDPLDRTPSAHST